MSLSSGNFGISGKDRHGKLKRIKLLTVENCYILKQGSLLILVFVLRYFSLHADLGLPYMKIHRLINGLKSLSPEIFT